MWLLIMIKLVKFKKLRQDEPTLLSSDGYFDIQECGILLKFPGKNKRHPSHAALIDKENVVQLVDELLVFLSNK